MDEPQAGKTKRQNSRGLTIAGSLVLFATSVFITVVQRQQAPKPPQPFPGLITEEEFRKIATPANRGGVFIFAHKFAQSNPKAADYGTIDDATKAEFGVSWLVAPDTSAEHVEQVFRDVANELAKVDGWQHYEHTTHIWMKAYEGAEIGDDAVPVFELQWEREGGKPATFIDMRGE